MKARALPSYDELHAKLSYDPETGLFVWKDRPKDPSWSRRWAGKPAFVTDVKGYCYAVINGKRNVAGHRVAYKMVHGVDPIGEIDHINGDRTDNRIVNLRAVSTLENHRNIAKSGRNKSGVMGVCWNKALNKWRSNISVGNRTVHLGDFEDVLHAIAARQGAERALGFHKNHGRSQC